MTRPIIFIVLCVLGIIAGHLIMTITFFGILLIAGFVGLVEYIPILKWIVYRCSATIDILLWILSAISIVALGVTIAGALGVASLAFTFVYRPYIQSKMAEMKQRKTNNL